MKVLFLDIDGVLNWRGTADRIDNYIGLCPVRIARLNKILEAVPGTKIVISSTWRHCFQSSAYSDFPGLVKLLKARGLNKDAEVLGPTPKRFSYVPRGGEIRMWIDEHQDQERRKRTRPKEPIEAIVVLDDDTSGMTGYPVPEPSKWDDEPGAYRGSIDLRPFHVVTTWDGEDDGVEGGLQDKHVELAIKVLNGHQIPVKKNPSHPEPEWVTVQEKDLTT